MDMAEVFALIGLAPRILGRALLMSRYIWLAFSSGDMAAASKRAITDYANARFGSSYRLRPWLLLDIQELKSIEDLINTGSNEMVLAYRDFQLSTCTMLAVVGALVTQAGTTALALPQLDQVHFTARGFLTMSAVISLLSVFTALLQQRTMGLLTNALQVRAWLSSEIYHKPGTQYSMLRSSVIAYHILQGPYELLTIGISLFLIGLGLYLGFAFTNNLKLSLGTYSNGGVLIAFIVGTAFALLFFGQLLGAKYWEEIKWKEEMRSNVRRFHFEMEARSMTQQRGNTTLAGATQGTTVASR